MWEICKLDKNLSLTEKMMEDIAENFAPFSSFAKTNTRLYTCACLSCWGRLFFANFIASGSASEIAMII